MEKSPSTGRKITAATAATGASSSQASDDSAVPAEFQFLIVVSTQQVRILVLPEHKRIHKFKLTDGDLFFSAQVATMNGKVHIFCCYHIIVMAIFIVLVFFFFFFSPFLFTNFFMLDLK